MKKKLIMRHTFGVMAVALVFSLAFASCKKNESDTSGSAPTTFKVTDAPIDDASVTAAFVTIADIKLDGVSIPGFTKTTVDLEAFQNGNTKTLGTFNLGGKTYSTITFVLDFDTDASGNLPGCYVVSNSGVKSKLQTTSNVITISNNILIQNGVASTIVADFDLRKMIVHQTGSGSDHFDFVTAAEMSAAVRLVFESASGTISGTLTDNVSASGKVVAYAYKKGTYNRTTEMQAQGTSGIEFKNAVSSALVGPGGNYQLHFLQSGDYEIHFASYKDTNADGEYELKGTLIVVGAVGIDFLNLSIAANATLTINATATGILP